ncbi:unnamed protein product [Cylindrotheca closterium]|uniref:Uncharacterized protein n=1 Tax=Cylindrotheca closterium TaxID=2856 RepID=A0AAD2G8I1_9STRA|nr:unnamed protein product [Cylindrotheca closterium]
MMKSRTPATQALNKLTKSQDSQSSLGTESQRAMKRMSMKRSMSSMMDMTSLLEASEEIEGFHSFPIIEWPTLDNNQDASDLCAPQIKRRCSGLPRCMKASLKLSSFTSTRGGSCGSMY